MRLDGKTVTELAVVLEGSVETSASLAPWTTFRTGGRADILVQAESEADLLELAKKLPPRYPIAIVGKGSNLLVSDSGFRGIVVRLGRAFRSVTDDGEGLILGGAVFLPAAARLTARKGMSGFEFAAEIPGSFGGAVRGNAGAHECCMADVLDWARVIDLTSAKADTKPSSELGYSYRHSNLSSSEVVVSGRIKLSRDKPEHVSERIAGLLRWRRANQPPGRSAGSVFKNPEGDFAGRIIEAAGGKEIASGGARISPVHANFITTTIDATSTDVWSVIEKTRTLVLEKSRINLELEVQLLGAFPQELKV